MNRLPAASAQLRPGIIRISRRGGKNTSRFPGVATRQRSREKPPFLLEINPLLALEEERELLLIFIKTFCSQQNPKFPSSCFRKQSKQEPFDSFNTVEVRLRITPCVPLVELLKKACTATPHSIHSITPGPSSPCFRARRCEDTEPCGTQPRGSFSSTRADSRCRHAVTHETMRHGRPGSDS